MEVKSKPEVEDYRYFDPKLLRTVDRSRFYSIYFIWFSKFLAGVCRIQDDLVLVFTMGLLQMFCGWNAIPGPNHCFHHGN